MDNTSTSAASGFMGSLGNHRNNIVFLNNNNNNVERSSDRHQDSNDDNVTDCTTTLTENGSESPLSSNLSRDFSKKMVIPSTSSHSSPKKSGRRSVQKRVVSIPIKELKGSVTINTPPSDSWAWRKYGQKPIKGSPYPRGYYRCSSSKGCPARKQVERSRADPTMLVVTYSAEHNHPWPASSRTNHHHQQPSRKPVKEEEEEDEELEEDTPESVRPDPEPQVEPIGFSGGLHDELMGSWFGADGHVETASTVLESSMTFADGGAAVFPVNMMEEEDESLFADLGELPECSLVFRHRGVGPQVEIC